MEVPFQKKRKRKKKKKEKEKKKEKKSNDDQFTKAFASFLKTLQNTTLIIH